MGHIILNKGHRISVIQRVPLAVDPKNRGVTLIQIQLFVFTSVVLLSSVLFSFGIIQVSLGVISSVPLRTKFQN